MDDQGFRDHLDQLKAAVRGPDIAAALGLRQRGKRFFCPSCQADGGKTPDFSVFDQGFKCFKCGLTGDLIDLAALAGDPVTHAEAAVAADESLVLGHPAAEYDLGLLYLQGQQFPQDFKRAAELFRTFGDQDKARAEGLAATIAAAVNGSPSPSG